MNYHCHGKHADHRPLVYFDEITDSKPYPFADEMIVFRKNIAREVRRLRFMFRRDDLTTSASRISGLAGILAAALLFILTAAFGSLQNHPLIAAVASSGFLALLMAALMVIFNYLKTRKLIDFFGFKEILSLAIVLPTFHMRRSSEAKPPLYPEGTYKISREKKSEQMPKPWIRLASYGDVIMVNSLYENRATSKNITISLIMDEAVAKNGELAPPYFDGRIPLICFGSEQFNDLAQMILKNIQVMSGDQAIRFEGSNTLRVDEIVAKHIGGSAFQSSEDTDFGLIAKVMLQPEKYPVPAFLCAGIDAPGTRILVSNLFRNWIDLYNKFETEEFFAIYRFSKRDYNKYYESTRFPIPLNNAYFIRKKSQKLFVPARRMG